MAILQITNGLSFMAFAAFLSFFVFYIVLPGRFLCHVGGPVESSNIHFGHYVALGYALLTLVFILGRHFSFVRLIYIYPIIFVPLLFFRIPPVKLVKYKNLFSFPISSRVIFIITVLILHTITLKFFILTPLSEGNLVSKATHHDYYWHLTIVGEALNRWPLKDPFCSGLNLVNHSLGHVAVAASALLSKVELSLVTFRLFHSFVLIALIFQIYTLAKYITNEKLIGIITLVLFFLFGESFPARGHLFTYIMMEKLTDFSFLLSLSYMAAWFYLVIRIFNSKTSSPYQYLILGIVTFIMTGTKVAFVPVLILSILCVALIRIFFYKEHKGRYVSLFLVTFIAFVFSFLLMLDWFGSRTAAGWFEFDPFAHEKASNFWRGCPQFLFDNTALKLTLFVVCLLGAYGLKLLGAIYYFFQKKIVNLNSTDLLLFFSSFLGLAITSTFRGRHGEELYFSHSASLPLAILGANGIFLLLSSKRNQAFWTVGALAVVLFVGSLMEFGLNYVGIFYWSANQSRFLERNKSLNLEILDAYKWIRGNTSPNDVIAVWPENAADYIAEALTERRVLLGGWYYMPEYMNGDHSIYNLRIIALKDVYNGCSLDSIKAIKVNYAVRYVLFDKTIWPESADYCGKENRVFENKSSFILEV